MKESFEGRLRNTELGEEHFLMPVFEAVVNSFQAIADAGVKPGSVTVEVQREPVQLVLPATAGQPRRHPQIMAFRIADDGIGFDDEHYEAFDTLDTLFRADKGGKGIGRVAWLKAFDRAEIDSRYRAADGTWRRRRFTFSSVYEGTGDHRDDPLVDGHPCARTEVALLGLRAPYKRHSALNAEALASRVIEHCLFTFRKSTCPLVTLVDRHEKIVLNDLFQSMIAAQAHDTTFGLNGNTFGLTSLWLDAPTENRHRVHFCGHERVVMSQTLSARQIPDLDGKLNVNGRACVYAAFVSGDSLDAWVSSSRTRFELQEDAPDGQMQLPGVYTFRELSDAVARHAELALQPYTGPARQRRAANIEQFIRQAPENRALVKRRPDVAARIPANASVAEIAQHYARARLEEDAKMQADVQAIAAASPGEASHEGFARKRTEILHRLNDDVRDRLASYVVHRKLILELLGAAVKSKGSAYPLEDQVHRIVFPMGATSDDVEYDQHNLWLVDERLVYHRYLASDRTLRSSTKKGVKSGKEPDIIAFEAAQSYVDTNGPYPSVVIVEFKRPGRDDYTPSKNPYTQVVGYMERIVQGKEKDADGRPLQVVTAPAFFCYIIADDTQSLVRLLRTQYSFKKTPDGGGWYFNHTDLNAYIEVIPYAKLETAATERNRAFFRQLGLTQY